MYMWVRTYKLSFSQISGAYMYIYYYKELM